MVIIHAYKVLMYTVQHLGVPTPENAVETMHCVRAVSTSYNGPVVARGGMGRYLLSDD